MKTATEHTTMICLFHALEQADAAVEDLTQLGIPRDSIGVMRNSGTAAANPVAMEKWKVPSSDAKVLTDGMNSGGIVVAVSANDEIADDVEDVFTRHKAAKIDEAVAVTRPVANPTRSSTVGGTIDVIEEQLNIGKRQVQRGGVRVYRRVVEKPVTESVNLREEHVVVERHAVNRPATTTDGFTDQSIEVRETGEEAVVSKQARVVEEVVIGKESTERTETVKDTVRKTDVVVEEIPVAALRSKKQ